MTLRNIVLVLGIIGIGIGLGALVMGSTYLAIYCLFQGIVLIVSTLFERHRYKAVSAQAPDATWQRTAERFIDPETGKPVRVYTNPASGERRYVQE